MKTSTLQTQELGVTTDTTCVDGAEGLRAVRCSWGICLPGKTFGGCPSGPRAREKPWLFRGIRWFESSTLNLSPGRCVS